LQIENGLEAVAQQIAEALFVVPGIVMAGPSAATP